MTSRTYPADGEDGSPTWTDGLVSEDWPGQFEGLTRREADVLTLLAEGLSNREIADALFIGEQTVKSHLRTIFPKLGVTNRTQAARRAIVEGLHPQ